MFIDKQKLVKLNWNLYAVSFKFGKNVATHESLVRIAHVRSKGSGNTEQGKY